MIPPLCQMQVCGGCCLTRRGELLPGSGGRDLVRLFHSGLAVVAGMFLGLNDGLFAALAR